VYAHSRQALEARPHVNASYALSVQARWLPPTSTRTRSLLRSSRSRAATQRLPSSGIWRARTMDDGTTSRCSRVRICSQARAITSAWCGTLHLIRHPQHRLMREGRQRHRPLSQYSIVFTWTTSIAFWRLFSSWCCAVTWEGLFSPSALDAAAVTTDMPRNPSCETF
jgi:hypothetical protein